MRAKNLKEINWFSEEVQSWLAAAKPINLCEGAFSNTWPQHGLQHLLTDPSLQKTFAVFALNKIQMIDWRTIQSLLFSQAEWWELGHILILFPRIILTFVSLAALAKSKGNEWTQGYYIWPCAVAIFLDERVAIAAGCWSDCCCAWPCVQGSYHQHWRIQNMLPFQSATKVN